MSLATSVERESPANREHALRGFARSFTCALLFLGGLACEDSQPPMVEVTGTIRPWINLSSRPWAMTGCFLSSRSRYMPQPTGDAHSGGINVIQWDTFERKMAAWGEQVEGESPSSDRRGYAGWSILVWEHDPDYGQSWNSTGPLMQGTMRICIVEGPGEAPWLSSGRWEAGLGGLVVSSCGWIGDVTETDALRLTHWELQSVTAGSIRVVLRENAGSQSYGVTLSLKGVVSATYRSSPTVGALQDLCITCRAPFSMEQGCVGVDIVHPHERGMYWPQDVRHVFEEGSAKGLDMIYLSQDGPIQNAAVDLKIVPDACFRWGFKEADVFKIKSSGK